MTTLTFLMLDRKTGSRTLPIEYRPLKVTVGEENHTLALHMVAGEWKISDPVCGGGICMVENWYKGVPVSSKGLGVREAKIRAAQAIDRLVNRSGGPAEWNARLKNARLTYGGASA